jgi:hypothetical protein
MVTVSLLPFGIVTITGTSSLGWMPNPALQSDRKPSGFVCHYRMLSTGREGTASS